MEAHPEAAEMIFTETIKQNGTTDSAASSGKDAVALSSLLPAHPHHCFLEWDLWKPTFFKGIELARNISDHIFPPIDLYLLVLVGSLTVVFRGPSREILKQ